jgi:putative endonuclease
LSGVRSGHYVYIVKCSDGSLYTGYTTDPDRRLREHNSGKGSRYTRRRRPVVLQYLEALPSAGKALSRELAIKSMNKRTKLLLCQKFLGSEKPSAR